MILVYFPSGECIDIFTNRTKYQFTSVTIIHFMDGTRMCWIIRGTAKTTSV